jgi:hypothetical protein
MTKRATIFRVSPPSGGMLDGRRIFFFFSEWLLGELFDFSEVEIKLSQIWLPYNSFCHGAHYGFR